MLIYTQYARPKNGGTQYARLKYGGTQYARGEGGVTLYYVKSKLLSIIISYI